MSVKSNDGGGGAIQRGQLLYYKYHCCLVFFWFCMEVPDPMGGIVQSVCHPCVCACTAFHFQITLSQYNDCFSHVQCEVYIPGFIQIQWEASAGFPPRILGVE